MTNLCVRFLPVPFLHVVYLLCHVFLLPCMFAPCSVQDHRVFVRLTLWCFGQLLFRFESVVWPDKEHLLPKRERLHGANVAVSGGRSRWLFFAVRCSLDALHVTLCI